MNNQIIDPWDLSQDFVLNFSEETIIKGPCKNLSIWT